MNAIHEGSPGLGAVVTPALMHDLVPIEAGDAIVVDLTENAEDGEDARDAIERDWRSTERVRSPAPSERGGTSNGSGACPTCSPGWLHCSRSPASPTPRRSSVRRNRPQLGDEDVGVHARPGVGRCGLGSQRPLAVCNRDRRPDRPAAGALGMGKRWPIASGWRRRPWCPSRSSSSSRWQPSRSPTSWRSVRAGVRQGPPGGSAPRRVGPRVRRGGLSLVSDTWRS